MAKTINGRGPRRGSLFPCLVLPDGPIGSWLARGRADGASHAWPRAERSTGREGDQNGTELGPLEAIVGPLVAEAHDGAQVEWMPLHVWMLAADGWMVVDGCGRIRRAWLIHGRWMGRGWWGEARSWREKWGPWPGVRRAGPSRAGQVGQKSEKQ